MMIKLIIFVIFCTSYANQIKFVKKMFYEAHETEAIIRYTNLEYNNEDSLLTYGTVSGDAFQQIKFIGNEINNLNEEDTTLFMVNLWTEVTDSPNTFVICSLINIDVKQLKTGVLYPRLDSGQQFIYYYYPGRSIIARRTGSLNNLYEYSTMHISIYKQKSRITVNTSAIMDNGPKYRRLPSIDQIIILPEINGNIDEKLCFIFKFKVKY
ncbi:uncharacterized protein LOC142333165 [Lycorma delicatula]|uniref:uncharacterized protein LOC142333165 n=1 Tax=Lycorma delicatula TaxID=130591 RepID=UPI003F5196DB